MTETSDWSEDNRAEDGGRDLRADRKDRPAVGEEIRYSAGRGGVLFLARVVRVVDIKRIRDRKVVPAETIVVAKNFAGLIVTVNLADLYVDAQGRWVEGVKYA
jgi:hypothetical protein